MFDTDTKKVAYFYTDDTGVSYASYWGDFSSGITINWTNGQGKEKFTCKGSGSDAILTDAMYSRPAGHQPEANIWGDYYYMEALMRLMNPDWEMYW